MPYKSRPAFISVRLRNSTHAQRQKPLQKQCICLLQMYTKPLTWSSGLAARPRGNSCPASDSFVQLCRFFNVDRGGGASMRKTQPLPLRPKPCAATGSTRHRRTPKEALWNSSLGTLHAPAGRRVFFQKTVRCGFLNRCRRTSVKAAWARSRQESTSTS